MKKVQTKMGGKLPDDFFVWLEVLTGKRIYFYVCSFHCNDI
jgi:hypothetical protein